MATRPRFAIAALLLGGVLAGTSAHAQQTWTYASFTENTTNAGTYGNSWSQTQNGVKLTVSAYSTTGSGGAFATAYVGNYGTGSGFGVTNNSSSEGVGTVASPQHAMDNFTNTDMLALNFSSSVVLSQVASGWHNTSATTTCKNNSGGTSVCGTDSDISLLRWDQSTGPTITGGTIAQLLAAGWTLVNNYADMVDDTLRATGADSTKASSWWLISAYNSAWGTGSNTANLSNGDDYVKVLSSITTVPATGRSGVPEPGTAAMVALALLTLAKTRQRARGRA
jgi:hypothetical protein